MHEKFEKSKKIWIVSATIAIFLPLEYILPKYLSSIFLIKIVNSRIFSLKKKKKRNHPFSKFRPKTKSNDDFDGQKIHICPSRIRRRICGGAIFVRRAPISYYAHVTLAHVNRKLRKIVSEDDLDSQRAARKGIGVKLALLLGSFMSVRGGKWRASGKKGFDSHHFLCTPKFPRSDMT